MMTPTARDLPIPFSEWMTRPGDGVAGESARRNGHHRLQIAVDTIAYAHNVPLRLLLPDRLKALPAIVDGLLKEPSILAVLRSDAPEMAATDYPSLASQVALEAAATWIDKLCTNPEPLPSKLPAHWLQGALALMPYIERKVWLTEMGNPLPAHALCRMQDHWSFFILMWTWQNADRLSEPAERVPTAMGVAGMEVRTLESIMLHRPDGTFQRCMPIVGPYFSTTIEAGRTRGHEAFADRFDRFVANVVQVDRDRDGRSHTVPLREEVLDALSTRIGLTAQEAELRARTTSSTLQLLCRADLVNAQVADGLRRSDWEVIAALVAWLARWEDAIAPHTPADQTLLLTHDGDNAAIAIRKADATDAATLRWRLCVIQRWAAPSNALALPALLESVDQAHGLQRADGTAHAYRVDRPERYFSRIKERQNAMWSSQVIAINNLLSRHAPRDVYIGGDEFPRTDSEGRDKVERDDAEHLLRGFGSRISRYLVSMTRADAAAIYWLDYAQSPPRLLPAGDYARHANHRSQGYAIWQHFDQWAWAPGTEPTNRCPAMQRQASWSQVYRVAATGKEDPPMLDPEGQHARADPQGWTHPRKKIEAVGDDIDQSEPWRSNERSDAVPAYMVSYPDPQPVDSVAAPLLVDGRVIGVVTLLGLVPGQFESQLFWPLRRSASLIAACMNHQSQVWHMRRLNYLFARRGLNEFQKRGAPAHQGTSPLRDVSRCLANMFLCPVAHIWLQSASNDDRFELLGHNWEHMFDFAGEPRSFARKFLYEPIAPRDDSAARVHRTFSSMAIELARSDTGQSYPLGRFVQGFVDADVAETSGYDPDSASQRGALLGRDYLEVPGSAQAGATAAVRKRIHGDRAEGGYRLLDIMAFALVSPSDEGWKTVGLVTLHDHGDVYREQLRKSQPWDRGWSSVVAHMQTYLPYLFRQAEVLHSPEVDARRYLIHAGRAELLGMLDNQTQMRQRLESALAPDKGVRRMIDTVMRADFKGDHREVLGAAQRVVTDAWETVQLSSSPEWEQGLRYLANVMHEYRELSRFQDVDIAVSAETLLLKPLLEETIARFALEFGSRRSREIAVPDQLEVRTLGPWLRIVLRDLIHNAAKYATGGTFDVQWEAASRSLVMVNESSYQSDIDRQELLIATGGQGSAGQSARSARSERQGRSDARGHGLGLWGAKLLCQIMDIRFSIEPKPMAATLKTDAAGVVRGTARYHVRLQFPASTTGNRQSHRSRGQGGRNGPNESALDR
jgi:signal transduction histidine kinase